MKKIENTIIGGGSVHPVLVMSDDTCLEIGAIFCVNEYYFKAISTRLAWMYNSDIGCYSFDLETNDYEKSELKEVIDNWFKIEILKQKN